MYTMKKIYFQYIYWKRICLYNEACLADAERWQKRCNVYGTIKFRKYVESYFKFKNYHTNAYLWSLYCIEVALAFLFFERKRKVRQGI